MVIVVDGDAARQHLAASQIKVEHLSVIQRYHSRYHPAFGIEAVGLVVNSYHSQPGAHVRRPVGRSIGAAVAEIVPVFLRVVGRI